MKKLFLSTLLLALPLLASAYDCQVDGIYYNLNSEEKTAEVTSGDNKYTGDAVIPEKFTYEGVEYSVTSIGNYAFQVCTGLTSVTIPNSVTTIGEHAFTHCTGLVSVTIPNSVTTIGSGAFGGCSGLTSVTIPNSVTTIGSGAFAYCTGLTSVTIGNSVTTIGNYAFHGCTGLTSVIIGNSVTSIGERAFEGCSSLTSVTIGNSVTSIGERTFYGCTGLTSVHITDLAAWCRISFSGHESNPLYYAHHLYMTGEEIKDLVIPNTVTSIGIQAFSGCTGLTSVTIPNSVTTIGSGAFGNCEGLTSVIIGNSVTTIGGNAFYNCNSLTSVTIGNSVTSIEGSAFSGCSSLTSVIIPSSVTSIGWYAFEGCSSLTSVTIPNSVTTIGYYAFENCTGLTSVIIGNSVISIGNYAFQNCTGLTSVTIGNSVTSIGDKAFADCKNIETINSKISKLFEIKENVFASETYINAKLKVPVGMAYKYQNTAAWNKFLVIEESDDSGEQGGDAEMVDLCIQDSEKGELTIGLEKGKSMIIFNNKNVTAQLNGNKFIIPALTGKSYLNISYEQTSDVNSAKTIPMLISANGGVITVNSEAEGQTVNVYSMDGKVLGSGVIRNGKATIQTNQPSGESFIVKAGNRSVKMLMK